LIVAALAENSGNASRFNKLYCTLMHVAIRFDCLISAHSFLCLAYVPYTPWPATIRHVFIEENLFSFRLVAAGKERDKQSILWVCFIRPSQPGAAHVLRQHGATLGMPCTFAGRSLGAVATGKQSRNNTVQCSVVANSVFHIYGHKLYL